jgi:hypothetical protein
MPTMYPPQRFDANKQQLGEIKKQLDKEKTSDMINIGCLFFEKNIVKFLNYDDLTSFCENIRQLKYLGDSQNGEPIFELHKLIDGKISETDIMCVVIKKGQYFHEYSGGKIINRRNETKIKENELEMEIMTIDNKIHELEEEYKELDKDIEITIDDDTLNLLNDYIKKIKKYSNTLLVDESDVQIEKDNLEKMLKTEMLDI